MAYDMSSDFFVKIFNILKKNLLKIKGFEDRCSIYYI